MSALTDSIPPIATSASPRTLWALFSSTATITSCGRSPR